MSKGEDFPKIHIFNHEILVDSIVVSGINVVTFNNNQDSIRIFKKSQNEFYFDDRYKEFPLTRLSMDIKFPDSTNLEGWQTAALKTFNDRAKAKNCPDLRTVGEKNLSEELKMVEDEFVGLIDIDLIPDWVEKELSKLGDQYERNLAMIPSYLEGDFNGDNEIDFAVSIKKQYTNQIGFALIFKNEKRSLIAGAGNELTSVGSDYNWVQLWEVYTDSICSGLIFSEAGDILESRDIKLHHDAVSIKEVEGSQILIYYDGSKLVSYQQTD